jgi:poly(A) polymerase
MAREANKSTAMWVLRRLREAGYTAYFAGGCVRDMLLGTRPKDYDIATDATPMDVQQLFRRVLLVGEQFGVAVVLRRDRRTDEDRHVEVATFRTDASYTDGRRPDAVTFTSPREDAQRRDFTINGMLYDPVDEQVIDYVGGQGDLAAGVIRTIGPPARRFGEDYLRMMRAIRFSHRLGFEIAPATSKAVRQLAGRIEKISGERIFDELTKMLTHPTAAEAVGDLQDHGLLEVLVPELFEGDNELTLGIHRLEAVAGECDAMLSFAALLCNLPQRHIRAIARRWGASNAMREGLCWLAGHRNDWRDAADRALCDFKRLMAGEHWGRLRKLWAVREELENHSSRQARRIAQRAGRIDPAQVAPAPLVNGRDLKQLGLEQGRSLGRILRQLYDRQLNEELADRESALREARRLVDKQLEADLAAAPPEPGTVCPRCGQLVRDEDTPA